MLDVQKPPPCPPTRSSITCPGETDRVPVVVPPAPPSPPPPVPPLRAKVAWLTPTGTVHVWTPPVKLKVWVAALAPVALTSTTARVAAITAAQRTPGDRAFRELLAPNIATQRYMSDHARAQVTPELGDHDFPS
jgi:hypothetical protein